MSKEREMHPENTESEAEWKVWHQDNFDRECPRQVEATGQGLLEGLIELWARHLYETVQANGQPGFSHFNLWWTQKGISVEVLGEWDGQVRLRGWVYRNMRQANKGYLEQADKELLYLIAGYHKNLILRGETSEAILAAVKASGSREAFIKQLLNIE
jgi:hypothetical protein